MRARTVAIVGSGPGVGKTSLVANLTWALQEKACVVAPFKAISIRGEDPWGHASSDTSLAATMLAWSAKQNPTADHCPYVVDVDTTTSTTTVSDVAAGNRVSDRVRVRGADAVDLSGVSEATLREMRRGCETIGLRLQARSEIVIIEGAGALGEVPAECDLANILLPQALGAEVVLVADGRSTLDSEAVRRRVAALTGQGLTLSGVVISRVERTPTSDELNLVKRAYGAPVIGVFHEIEDAKQFFHSRGALEELWSRTSPSMSRRGGLVEAMFGHVR